MDKRPPLKLIAAMVGVSKMTVSRALKEGTPVDPIMREKVRQAARKLGYQPDQRISQVMSAIRKSQVPRYRENLAFVRTHRLDEVAGTDLPYEEEAIGARTRAQQLGYKIDEFHLNGTSMNGRALSRVLHSRGIRGALITPPSRGSHPHVWLDWKQFCCVLIGRSFANAGLPRVQHDHYFGCVLAIRQLKRRRCRRIALILSRSMDERSAHLTRSAFISFHPLGPTEGQNLIFIADQFEPRRFRKWMKDCKPDAFLANFEKGFPQLEQLREVGSSSMPIASLNWSDQTPDIPGINQHRSVIGEQAVDLLLLRLQGNQFGLDPLAPSIKVPGSWMSAALPRK
jgi:LacI family transcriptional regulator